KRARTEPTRSLAAASGLLKKLEAITESLGEASVGHHMPSAPASRRDCPRSTRRAVPTGVGRAEAARGCALIERRALDPTPGGWPRISAWPTNRTMERTDRERRDKQRAVNGAAHVAHYRG